MAHADRAVGAGTVGPGAGRGGGPRGAMARNALLPLRIFLGVTFVYAGLDKLTDPAFFAASGTGSIGELMRQVRDTSAVPQLVDLALKNPAGFGYAIAAGSWRSASAHWPGCSRASPRLAAR